jgi:hypothetical protein
MTRRFQAATSAAFAIAIAVATVTATLAVQAQSTAPAVTAPAPATAAPRVRPDRIEGRLAFLKAELKITEQQATLWNAVADALRENNRASRALREQIGVTHNASASVLDRLQMQERFTTVRADGTRRLLAALRPLYDAMTDPQKKSADELLGGPMMGPGGPHMGRRPGRA